MNFRLPLQVPFRSAAEEPRTNGAGASHGKTRSGGAAGSPRDPEERGFLGRSWDRQQLIAVVLCGAAVVGGLAAVNPLLVLAVVAIALFAVIFSAAPQAGTVAVVAVLFTNAAVVAVKFHGAPPWTGSLVPLLLVGPAHLSDDHAAPAAGDRPGHRVDGRLPHRADHQHVGVP